MQNYISKPFPTNQGVRQGCVLSPLLFDLCMADFTEEINKCADRVKISDDVDAGCILWADDILLLSESEGGGGGGTTNALRTRKVLQ